MSYMIAYNAIFNDKSEYSLYGKEYFTDKAVFARYHISNLIPFSLKVCKEGIPLKIIELNNNNREIYFQNDDEFFLWFKKNQGPPNFGFAKETDHEKVLKIVKESYSQMKAFLVEEMKTIKDGRYSHWTHSGGYKYLESESQLITESLKILSHRFNYDQTTIRALIKMFSSPFDIDFDGESLISYKKKGHDDISQETLNLHLKSTHLKFKVERQRIIELSTLT